MLMRSCPRRLSITFEVGRNSMLPLVLIVSRCDWAFPPPSRTLPLKNLILVACQEWSRSQKFSGIQNADARRLHRRYSCSLVVNWR